MSKPWEINCDCCLVIPDIHQCIHWAKAVMETERGKFDRLLFNGDIIDPRNQLESSNTFDTAQFYLDLLANYDVNLGNHDAATMEMWPMARDHKMKSKYKGFQFCSGQSTNRNEEFNKLLGWSDWQKVTLFRVVNGWFISHAGYCLPFGWDSKLSNDDNLAKLWETCKEVVATICTKYSDLTAAGVVRGGYAPKGGMTWLDFECEFDDDVIPLRQIVGHTKEYNTVRQIGNSFCIDGRQSTYSLVYRDGRVEHKSLKCKKETGPGCIPLYEPQEPQVVKLR